MQLNERAGVILGAITGAVFALLLVVGIGAYASGPVHTTPVVRTTGSFGAGSGTSLTLTQGISAVSGEFSGNVGITGTLGVTGAASLKSTLGVGGAVSITGSVGITGTSGTTGLTLVGPSGGQSLSISGPPIGAFNALNITDGNGTTTAARFGILVNNWANTIGGAAAKFVAIGANGDALIADGSGALSGYTLKLLSDTTSPARAHISFSQNNANPSGGALGDLAYILSGSTAQFRTYTATSTWNPLSGIKDIATGITAFAGGGQASATAVCTTAGSYTITVVATAADSVKFPSTPVLGQECDVWNADAADAAALFPGSGDQLCVTGAACLAADASTSIAANNGHIRCIAESAALWRCHP